MRTLLLRWLAVVALLVGVSVGAAASPASAATPAGAPAALSAHHAPGARPMDWWL